MKHKSLKRNKWKDYKKCSKRIENKINMKVLQKMKGGKDTSW